MERFEDVFMTYVYWACNMKEELKATLQPLIWVFKYDFDGDGDGFKQLVHVFQAANILSKNADDIREL